MPYRVKCPTCEYKEYAKNVNEAKYLSKKHEHWDCEYERIA